MILVGSGLFASILPARVYFSQNVDFFNPTSFGRLVYKTVMEINGAKADVSVVGCDDGLSSVQAALSRPQDPRLRVLALRADPERPALLFTVIQSSKEQINSPSRQVRHRLGEVPVPSDGIVHGSLKNADTRTTFEYLTSNMGKADVIHFYELAMAQYGWAKRGGSPDGSSLLFYVKGTDVCVVVVCTQESNGETGITLLHKQGALN